MNEPSFHASDHAAPPPHILLSYTEICLSASHAKYIIFSPWSAPSRRADLITARGVRAGACWGPPRHADTLRHEHAQQVDGTRVRLDDGHE